MYDECQKIKDLVKDANIAWCVDIFKRIDDILRKHNITDSDISQIHWLVKQGLKAEREE